MKKVLVILLAIAMVTSVFAAEPVANVNVAEFSGEASVTWGVDLDTNKTGFANDAKVVLKLNLFNGGEKSTTGEGVWGELKIKTDSDTFIGWEGTGGFDANKGMQQALDATADPTEKDLYMKVVVDVAKIHFGNIFYVGIKSGDTTVGEYKLDTAISAEQTKNANVGTKREKGIVAGFVFEDLATVDIDFRSNPAATKYTDDYAFAVDAALKAVDNLTLKGGFAKDFYESDFSTLAYYAAADYKLALSDVYYLKPQAGLTSVKTGSADATTQLAAAVLFGWGEKADEKPGLYYFDDDSHKKVIPGFSVAFTKTLSDDTDNGLIDATVFSGDDLVENLKFAARFIKSTAAEDFSLGVAAKYEIAVAEGTVTPQVGFLYGSSEFFAEELTVGCDFAGFVDNTTFSVKYVTTDIENVKGTLDFTAKIAL